MNALSKLKEKNKIQMQHQRNDWWSFIWMILIMSPGLFSYGFEFYHAFKGLTVESPHPVVVFLSAFIFGLPLAALGDLMLFKRRFKLVLFLLCQCWFTWFLVIEDSFWLALFPLIPASILLQIQLPTIKARSKNQ